MLAAIAKKVGKASKLKLIILGVILLARMIIPFAILYVWGERIYELSVSSINSNITLVLALIVAVFLDVLLKNISYVLNGIVAAEANSVFIQELFNKISSITNYKIIDDKDRSKIVALLLEYGSDFIGQLAVAIQNFITSVALVASVVVFTILQSKVDAFLYMAFFVPILIGVWIVNKVHFKYREKEYDLIRYMEYWRDGCLNQSWHSDFRYNNLSKLIDEKLDIINEKWTKGFASFSRKQIVFAFVISSTATVAFLFVYWLANKLSPSLEVAFWAFGFVILTGINSASNAVGFLLDGLQVFRWSKKLELFTTQHNKNSLNSKLKSLIELKNVVKEYDDSDFEILIESLIVEEGKKYLLVGENGAGKTTLLNVLQGLMPVSSGDVLWKRKLKVSRYSTNLKIPPVDIQELFSVLSGYNHPFIRKTLASIEGSVDARNSLLTEVHRSSTLSGGEIQKLLLSRAVVAEADIYLLDEPTSSMDPVAKYEAMDFIFHYLKSKTVIIVSHREEDLILFDHVLKLSNGSLYHEDKMKEATI